MARLLDGIEYPRDVRKLTLNELPQLATEIREEVISVVSEVGGHLASTLGAVELTLLFITCLKPPKIASSGTPDTRRTRTSSFAADASVSQPSVSWVASVVS